MLNKIFLVGEVTVSPSVGQMGANNLSFARFKLEVRNKSGQKPDNFSAIGWGTKAKLAQEISLGDLVFLEGQIKLANFRNEKQELIYYQEVKIDNYYVIAKNHKKIIHPSQMTKHIEINNEQMEKLFGDWMKKQKENG